MLHNPPALSFTILLLQYATAQQQIPGTGPTSCSLVNAGSTGEGYICSPDYNTLEYCYESVPSVLKTCMTPGCCWAQATDGLNMNGDYGLCLCGEDNPGGGGITPGMGGGGGGSGGGSSPIGGSARRGRGRGAAAPRQGLLSSLLAALGL